MNRRLIAVASFAALAATARVAADDGKVDAEGAKDHPAVKRYPGSVITRQVAKEHEFFLFPVSTQKTERAEGRFHWASYEFPAAASCTQVLRNYENAFRAAGLKVYAGRGVPEMDVPEDYWGDAFVTGIGPAKSGGTVYVTQSCGGETPATGVLAVVEVKAMAQKVEVSDFMADQIEKTGRVAVYGIQFAFGKADITPGSEEVLAEIARLLEAKPDWKLRVEGHTDNVGGSKANLELSKRRAQSVKEWLVSKHGVAASRLATDGFGDTHPVADNKTEEGRAKNRRVELAKN